MKKQILVIEDEAAIREMITFILMQKKYEVIEASDYEEGLTKARTEMPLLILLDWMLPGGSGLNLIKQLKQRKETQEIPIIMLTARGEEEDKVRGLDAGADDYMTKPFSPSELLARIKAMLRRTSTLAKEDQIVVNELELDPASHRLMYRGEPVELAPIDFRLLHFFMTHQERVFNRNQLLDRIWGNNVYVEDRTIDVHIRRLRKALVGTGGDKMIQTVRGAGYRFSSRLKKSKESDLLQDEIK